MVGHNGVQVIRAAHVKQPHLGWPESACLLGTAALHTCYFVFLQRDYGSNVGRSFLLLPLAAQRWDQVKAEWTTKPGYVLAVAVLIPFSYILVLTAMAFTPVSYVAPAREISILVGTIFGSRLLGEGHSVRRVAAGGAMVVG